MKNKEIEEVFDETALKVLTKAEIKIVDLNENYGSVTVTGKVTHLFDQLHDSIAQAGLIGDETGVTRFVIWKDGKGKPLEFGKVYTLEDYRVNSYEGKLSLTSNKNSNVTKKDVEIDVYIENAEEVGPLTAFVVEIKKAAITKLCDDPLDQDCKKKTKWGFDVRMVLDSGVSTMTIDVRDFVLLDLTIDKVKKTVMESGDPSMLLKVISEKLSGRYLQVEREYEAQRYFLIMNKELLKMVI